MTNAVVTTPGFWTLILESGFVAKGVLLLLIFASVFTWALIFSKTRSLRRALRQNSSFLETFWAGKNLEEVFSKLDKFTGSPTAAVFRSGIRELKRLSEGEVKTLTSDSIDNIQRSLSRASNQEIALYERHIGWLATIASGAPFVGLFGTVWGIMDSFQRIGATGAANLAVVAPGISEALIATAFGIGAAIPAVIAYNHFAGQIRRIANDMDNFSQDFLNIVHRGILTGQMNKGAS